jgi:hypothetical protein
MANSKLRNILQSNLIKIESTQEVDKWLNMLYFNKI